MSRIGKKPINVPSGVQVSADGNLIKVKGPKGELSQKLDADLSVEIAEGQITISRPTEQKRHKALHGLYRTLVNNAVVGVSEGYEKRLELVGVGYKADAKGQVLEMNLGYSHLVVVVLPAEVSVETETAKGQNPKIILRSIDKQLVGHMASKIRSLRAPEPYKGKGIRYVGEVVRRKAGKTAAK